MIRTVLTVLGLMLASFIGGMVWEAHPELHIGVISWAESRFTAKCPTGQICIKQP